MKPSFCAALVSVAALIAGAPALADSDFFKSRPVPGAKIDSGLGELPPYVFWTDPTGRKAVSLGEKQDSGLGELPHYSKWKDPTGKNPMGTPSATLDLADRQPVIERVLGEKQDSGLGELPHYSKWKDPTGKNPVGTPSATLELALGRIDR